MFIARKTRNSPRRSQALTRRAIDLLEARAFQRALEGDLEPVYYMGVVVDYVRKFDSNLQIELLRAKRPESFKTPGVNVNVGTKGDVFVLTEEQRHILMDYKRRETLAWEPPAAEPPADICIADPLPEPDPPPQNAAAPPRE
jgi:hypothetical protein